MIQETKTTTVTKPSFNEQAVKERFDSLKKSAEELAGKAGYNPFLYFATKIKPLQDRFNKGERSTELQSEILALPPVVPPLK